MNPHLKRADGAERFLADPLFQEASEGIERAILKQLRETQLDGKPETERYCLELVRTLQSGERLKRMLGQWVNTGRIAENELERKRMFKGGI